MIEPTGLDLASIPGRIQSEVQRAIQRSIRASSIFRRRARRWDRRQRTSWPFAAP
jgi:hypothetical protein